MTRRPMNQPSIQLPTPLLDHLLQSTAEMPSLDFERSLADCGDDIADLERRATVAFERAFARCTSDLPGA